MAVATDGLQAKMADRSVHYFASEALKIAAAGLKSRAMLDDKGQDETKFSPLRKLLPLAKPMQI